MKNLLIIILIATSFNSCKPVQVLQSTGPKEVVNKPAALAVGYITTTQAQTIANAAVSAAVKKINDKAKTDSTAMAKRINDLVNVNISQAQKNTNISNDLTVLKSGATTQAGQTLLLWDETKTLGVRIDDADSLIVSANQKYAALISTSQSLSNRLYQNAYADSVLKQQLDILTLIPSADFKVTGNILGIPELQTIRDRLKLLEAKLP